MAFWKLPLAKFVVVGIKSFSQHEAAENTANSLRVVVAGVRGGGGRRAYKDGIIADRRKTRPK
jgi:hypothetical protein